MRTWPQRTCSLYDNLTLGSPNTIIEDVVQACQLAEIHEFIDQLPQGYQTEVGEHGIGLSGGQKQRIAIARALLKRPKILIFDRATSNLDNHTAEQFARTINRLRGKVTMLYIAHQVQGDYVPTRWRPWGRSQNIDNPATTETIEADTSRKEHEGNRHE